MSGDVNQMNNWIWKMNRNINRAIIFCEVPWEYNDGYLHGLCVNEIGEKDCLLLITTDGENLERALRLIHAWEFRYCTVFAVYVKMENTLEFIPTSRLHTYPRAEFVLLAKRGNTQKYLLGNKKWVGNVVEERMSREFRKPACYRRMVESIYEDLPRVQVFGTEIFTGYEWDHINSTFKREGKKRGVSSLVVTDKEEVQKCRLRQEKMLNLCKDCVRINRTQLDSANKYGLARNKQSTLESFFKPKK
jgi:N6-adenosine-specific RNA methylase IME4